MDREKERGPAGRSGVSTERLAELIRRGIQGDEQALEGLYNVYKSPLFSIAYRYTRDAAAAEDILQEVFLKVFAHLQDINNVETFTAWIHKIGVNASLSYLRSRRTERKKSVPMSAVEGRIEEAHYDAEPAVFHRPLEKAIEALPARLKSVFLLHDVQGFKHEEIAELLGCSVGTSKSHLFKARMRMRGLLKAGTAGTKEA